MQKNLVCMADPPNVRIFSASLLITTLLFTALLQVTLKACFEQSESETVLVSIFDHIPCLLTQIPPEHI